MTQTIQLFYHLVKAMMNCDQDRVEESMDSGIKCSWMQIAVFKQGLVDVSDVHTHSSLLFLH